MNNFKVYSDTEMGIWEFKRVSEAMENNGYPKHFMEKAISKQLKGEITRED